MITNYTMFGFLSLMLFGLTTLISLVNNPHLTAFGSPWCELHESEHSIYEDHDQIVDTIFDVMSPHFKTINHHFQQQQGYNNNEDDQYSDIIVAKIRGEEAKKTLSELENGSGIYFQITMDENDNPVIELHKEKWIIQNLPSDKKEQNQATY